ncbi:unnamed protein product [Symbiodinium necroappetens]|uniref:Uncharacterized protein n=1 Tax=Symbiodinium necroappetens TaxID=1628268 RepID=A0A813AZ90_9DINO|nr:unnamed protein product [Symbiodinium necroappetens]
MDRTVYDVDISGLGVGWHANLELKDRLLEEGSKGLILPPEGEKVPLPMQSTAILNDAFLIPIAIQMRAARNLKIPSLDALEAELLVTWTKYFESKERKKVSGSGRYPSLPQEFKMPASVEASVHQDAKYLKSLLSMIKKQFLSERQARDVDYRRIVANFGNKEEYPELDAAEGAARDEVQQAIDEIDGVEPPQEVEVSTKATAAKSKPRVKEPKQNEFPDDDCVMMDSANAVESRRNMLKEQIVKIKAMSDS